MLEKLWAMVNQKPQAGVYVGQYDAHTQSHWTGTAWMGRELFESNRQTLEREYQEARARSDYERAMAQRRKEVNVRIVHGSNGWVVEMEGQAPWVCKELEELGETITAAMATRVLEGGGE